MEPLTPEQIKAARAALDHIEAALDLAEHHAAVARRRHEEPEAPTAVPDPAA